MKIALIGATGYIGSKLLEEGLARGHELTALVTRPEKLAPQDKLTATRADVQNAGLLAEQLKDHDAVVSAFSGHAQGDVYAYYLAGIQSIIAAAKQAGVPRLLMVGGAGSLEVAPGLQLVDTPAFPSQWKATAEGARQALHLLKQEADLNWTMLSPAAHIEPGERTGQFRLGTDRLLVDAHGESHISLQDYAVALFDELEKPAHVRRRFTVAY